MNKYEKTRNEFVKDATEGKKRLSPLKAIRCWCLECCGYQFEETKDCQGDDCPLYKFRFGRNMTGRKK